MSPGKDLDAPELFDAADCEAPAELFVARRAGSARGGLSHHRFDTAEEAIAFAVDELASLGPNDVVMTVEDKRFNFVALRAIHRAGRHRKLASTSVRENS